jgi:hypothetical protein
MAVEIATIINKIRGLIKDLLITDGRNAFEYDTDASFSLSECYVSESSVKVFVNGTELTTDWNYSADTNKVTITSSLTKGDNIIITFSYYGKYSDSEITSYISANLTRFTQKKYKRRFYMNDSNKVVTQNGQNPNYREADIIALVTAIDIDPQNINVRIGNDFTVNSAETKSKSELINDVLSEFMRSYGVIDFLEIED